MMDGKGTKRNLVIGAVLLIGVTIIMALLTTLLNRATRKATAGLVIGATIAKAAAALPFVYDTKNELIGTGDFNGDGRADVVIVDKAKGLYRLGFGTEAGSIDWVKVRNCRCIGLTGLGIGPLLDAKKDSLIIASADKNVVLVVDASDPATPKKPIKVDVSCMGPSTATVAPAGQAGMQLVVGSIFNADPEDLVTVFKYQNGKFSQVSEEEAPGKLANLNRVTFKEGGPEYVVGTFAGSKGGAVAMEFTTGKRVVAAKADGIPGGAAYVVGHFRGQPLAELVFYKPGEKELIVKPVEEAGGKPQFGAGTTFTLDKIIREVVAVGTQLLVVHETNEPAVLYDFNGTQAPKPAQTLTPKKGEIVCGAFATPNGFCLLYMPEKTRFKFATGYGLYRRDGGQWAASINELPSMDEDDTEVCLEIHRRIVENTKITSPADMKPYTNTILGTPVKYSMVPIPGGEFMMGSPETEKGRSEDESPQHRVKIDPFWMGQFEVTWNEYELFMYPDDEKKLRQIHKSDPKVDEISDLVTRPSKPYVEMSFGMGKEGFPAIAMTQHGANKYCQWLSARTGEFYRLPTEAEWEYACRAGTTTAYFFGDDPSKLDQYAWFEKNSDFDSSNGDLKYQKVGTKKPNPWGLYDIIGNVCEWTLDQYEPRYQVPAGVADNPWVKATKPYPHVVRGGSFDDPAEKLRSAARKFSGPEWKQQDPQLPKSFWYLTDAKFVGFRIVRPLKVPSAVEMQKYWNSGVEKD